MSKLRFSSPSPRSRLLPVALLCLIIFTYLRFSWFTSPAPLIIIPEPSSTNPAPRILLVSALFPLEHAKHSHDDYKAWLHNFIGPDGVQCDVYFYTTPELEDLVRSLESSRTTVNTTFDTPFAIPPLSGYREKYMQMHAWDRERALHSPELYAVWNAKPWLLEHALINRGSHDYDYAFWVDAGSFRAAHPFRTWPDPARVQSLFSAYGEDRVLIPLFKLPGRTEYAWRVEKGPVDMDFGEGSFFGSSPSSVSWFSKGFYQTHDRYINAHPPTSALHPHANPTNDTTPQFHFVGKDQTLINTILFRYPQRFLGILAPSQISLLPPTPIPIQTTTTTATTPEADTASESEPEPENNPPYALSFTSLLLRARAAILRVLGFGRECGDWYYYQWWLASPGERERAREMGWVGCGETGTNALKIDALLRGLFGARWVEGRRAGGG